VRCEDDPDRLVVAMRARELGRTPVVVGDQVDLVGDVSGTTDTLARIVRVAERSSVLRRTADDTDPFEAGRGGQRLATGDRDGAPRIRRPARVSSTGAWSRRTPVGCIRCCA